MKGKKEFIHTIVKYTYASVTGNRYMFLTWSLSNVGNVPLNGTVTTHPSFLSSTTISSSPTQKKDKVTASFCLLPSTAIRRP